ncbi:inhibitory synaptic factor 2A isoform X2 [Ambystoma mexicanum]|uniref:inhibitory synaptic factor 2A isoform X2 n=1 Tax=Ambystoma mexicanum TaxID=8296 RepID=UPI0037E776FF
MVSKEDGKCLLTTSESEVEPSVSLALEMKYVLDPNRHIKKRNKALQVRFKDICEAQNEQREKQLSAMQQREQKDSKAISYKSAYRKYMTVPARRSIPNVTKSTGVQTSPDLKKRYQTFPLDRKKGNFIKNAAAVESFKTQNNGFLLDLKDKKESGYSQKDGEDRVVELSSDAIECVDAVHGLPTGNCSEACENADLHSCPLAPPPSLHNSADSACEEPDSRLQEKAKHERGPPGNEDYSQSAHWKVFQTEEATVHIPALESHAAYPDLSDSTAETEWSLCPAEEEEEDGTVHLNGLQELDVRPACSAQAQCQTAECNEQTLQINVLHMEDTQPCQTAVAVSDECQQIVPHTEVVDLKAQLHLMENLISSSQETIKVLLGVIQELEKGEAQREGLSYRTGQDTANCDTCRNSACIIYSNHIWTRTSTIYTV